VIFFLRIKGIYFEEFLCFQVVPTGVLGFVRFVGGFEGVQ
jgi:uncharacterized integral membrane protein